MGQSVLHYSDERFWFGITPRFLWSQIKVHFELENAKWGGGKSKDNKSKDVATGYIDQIPGWG
jgi:hypothetical protein